MRVQRANDDCPNGKARRLKLGGASRMEGLEAANGRNFRRSRGKSWPPSAENERGLVTQRRVAKEEWKDSFVTLLAAG